MLCDIDCQDHVLIQWFGKLGFVIGAQPIERLADINLLPFWKYMKDVSVENLIFDLFGGLSYFSFNYYFLCAVIVF